MKLHEAVQDSEFLSRDKWIRRQCWIPSGIAFSVDQYMFLNIVPDKNGGKHIGGMRLDELLADDWELVDPKDVCEGR